MNRKRQPAGFTLIEIMIVVVIIGILTAMTAPRYLKVSSKAKQTEAKSILKQVYTMQAAYFGTYQSYCLNGAIASVGNPNAFARLDVAVTTPARYTYTMIANAAAFTCTATADLDPDPSVDTWVINQDGTLRCTIDDSAD